MSWENVDNKHKKAIDKKFVSCEEKYERDTIKRIIKEEYPSLSDEKIEKAIEHCCKAIASPRPRDKYMACLRGQLGV